MKSDASHAFRHAGLTDRVFEDLRFLRVDDDRFFAVDVLAGFNSSERGGEMVGVWRADMNDVDFGIVDNFAVVRRCDFALQSALRVCRAFGTRGRDRNDLADDRQVGRVKGQRRVPEGVNFTALPRILIIT